MTKINFETIKKIVLDEKYTGNEMEVQALGGNVEGVAKILESMGMNGDDAGTVIQLIKSGMSSEEAVMSIKKE